MSYRKQVAQAEARYRALVNQANSLSAEHASLSGRERLLTAWCSALDLLQEHAHASGAGKGRHGGLRHAAVQEEDSRWYQQQQQDAAQLRSSSRELVTAANGECISICPAVDPVAHFRKLLALPVLPSAATMTEKELAQIIRDTALEAGVQQHLLHTVGPGSEQEGAILQKMQQIWDRYLHALTSLFLMGRMHIAEAATFRNLETLQADPDGCARHEAVIASRVQQLKLTPQQVDALAVGGQLYFARMGEILAAREQVQSSAGSRGAAPLPARLAQGQQAGDGSGEHSPCAADTPAAHQHSSSSQHSSGRWEGRVRAASSSNGGNGACGRAEPQLDTLAERQEELSAAKECVEQLDRLLWQQERLRMISMAWVVGCLSWQQLTMLATICWPFMFKPAVLVTEVIRQYQQQQQVEEARKAKYRHKQQPGQ